jgi:ubiquinone/menaquinone biosynthesis C-methylase UbiE
MTSRIRLTQIVAWCVVGLFVVGFFVPAVGMWTGAVLGAWFVGTQRPLRGFLWMMVFALLPRLATDWRAGVASVALAALISVLPFSFHRLVSPYLPGFLSTLPLPLAGVVLQALKLNHGEIIIYWFAAVVLWLWNGAGTFAAAGKRRRPWANRPEIALLQSPYTRAPLHVVREDGRETLVSSSGERFPIRHGMPVFLKLEELTGSNRKYNRLYQTIGGFYDDFQRVWYALRAMGPDAHFRCYLPLLEIKPGDLVLETSVGTGLNFKYLPRGIQLFGLDLSPEMLARCETNLRRWRLDADLFLGNAESLPFADSSFDVVFHVGGINFFSDRAKAIQEMIRVAKPGSLILIADETEKHVKETYERMPITSRYFKGRKETVAAPIDLVPPEMQEVQLRLLLGGRFYALTFRKPAEQPRQKGE